MILISQKKFVVIQPLSSCSFESWRNKQLTSEHVYQLDTVRFGFQCIWTSVHLDFMRLDISVFRCHCVEMCSGLPTFVFELNLYPVSNVKTKSKPEKQTSIFFQFQVQYRVLRCLSLRR